MKRLGVAAFAILAGTWLIVATVGTHAPVPTSTPLVTPVVDIRIWIAAAALLVGVAIAIVDGNAFRRAAPARIYGLVFGLTVALAAGGYLATGWARYNPSDRPVTDLFVAAGAAALLTLALWRLVALLSHHPEDAP